LVERDRPLGAQLGEDALAIGPHPLLDVAEVDVVEREIGARNRDCHGRPRYMSPMLGMKGGTPVSDFANSALDSASIMSIVHGVSAVDSVTGRQPRNSCTWPPITFTTWPVT